MSAVEKARFGIGGATGSGREKAAGRCMNMKR
jgi:hypothetical protein